MVFEGIILCELADACLWCKGAELSLV